MHRSFAAVVAPLIEALEPRSIVETGAGAGRLTRRLLEAPGAQAATIHAIDPAPRLDPDLVSSARDRLEVHAERSVSALSRLPACDLALLDGDPNWYTAHTELEMLERAARREELPAPLVAIHHIHWPFGRRDGYYEPTAIPEAERREHTSLGVLPGRAQPVRGGLRLAPYCAVREFEPHSGVLTALEDAISTSELDWRIVEIPAFCGLAVMAEARLLSERPALAEVLDGFASPLFLGRQVRRAESARLSAEVELAALQEGVEVELGPVPGADEREQLAEAAPAAAPMSASGQRLPAPQVGLAGAIDAERSSLIAQLAEHRAQRESLEWRLEQLEGDLAGRVREVESLAAENDRERRHAIELDVRLDVATKELEQARSEATQARSRVSELETLAESRGSALKEAEDRERVAQGRLAHREDEMQAVKAESDSARERSEALGAELEAQRAELGRVVELLRAAGDARPRRFARLRRALGMAAPAPDPLDQALAAAAELGSRSLPGASETPDPRPGLPARVRD